jgi:hypothetical protein
MEFICEFCKKSFSTKSNLNFHIKNAKICILNRDNHNQNTNSHVCKYCSKTYNSKQKLNIHLEKCINFLSDKKNEKIIKELEDIKTKLELKEKEIIFLKECHKEEVDKYQNQINTLTNKLEKICMEAVNKPTSTISNNITNKNNDVYNTYNQLTPVNLSPEHIYEIFDKNLKLEDIYKGQKGLANVVAKKLLTDENGRPLAFCNDKSRQIIKYKDENNQIVKDAKAFNLVSSIAPVAEKIALKRKKEFEDIHFPKEENKENKSIKRNRKDDDDYVGFEDEDTDLEDFEDEEINEKLEDIQREKDKDVKKQKFNEIYNKIENENNWSQEKKDYYHNKMITGITDLQILTANCNGFTKQLSMVLPAEKKI